MKLSITVIFILLLLSCSGTEEIRFKPLTIDNISGETLWERITTESDYQTYGYFENQKGILPGQSPHGVLHEIFVNADLLESIPVSDEVPYGSIIVKENYTPDTELDKLTVMVKVEGYNPEHNDWFWAAYSPAGRVLVSGTPGGCISCHQGMKYNDYIIVEDIRR